MVELSQVLDSLAKVAAKVLAAEAAAVLTWDEAKSSMSVAAAFGVGKEKVTPLLRSGEEGPRLVTAGGETVSQDVGLPPGFAAALAVPLHIESRLLGAVQVYGVAGGQFSSEQAECLDAMAGLGALAMQAAREAAYLEQIEASKSRFVRVATHELRSPITVAQSLMRTVIKGYAGAVNDDQRDIFERIAGRLDFLESLVNDLLEMAASKAPELEEEESLVMLNASVGRAILQIDPQAVEKGIEVEYIPCCEKVGVWASEEGLDRIFVNLVGNAVKYTPSGGSVTVTLELMESVAQVEVKDTGIGIPEDSLGQLFEEFYRAPNARKFDIGTGLGLTIVKDLVERYGGSVSVESVVGEGSCFTVTIPLYQP